MDDELKGAWKEAVLAYSIEHPRISLKGQNVSTQQQ
jgi:hypothetical protein